MKLSLPLAKRLTAASWPGVEARGVARVRFERGCTRPSRQNRTDAAQAVRGRQTDRNNAEGGATHAAAKVLISAPAPPRALGGIRPDAV